MVELGKSEVLGREIRKDRWSNIGVSTWSLLEEAILEGGKEEALALLDYLHTEGKNSHDLESDSWAAYITYLGSNFGEKEIERAWRDFMAFKVSGVTAETRLESAKERVYVQAEIMRAHYQDDGQLKVTEEEDRYIIWNNPCGSGGRMRMEGRLKPPYNFGVTSKPYPWSWYKTGVPWYCIHCSLGRGVLAIEAVGYPVRVHEYPENPEDACLMIFYKKPQLIPEKYFTELGMEKRPSMFRIME